MANCINKNMPGYQTLKERSGVSELLLDSVCDVYLQQYRSEERRVGKEC